MAVRGPVGLVTALLETLRRDGATGALETRLADLDSERLAASYRTTRHRRPGR
jgi:hypothetical protein